MYSQCVNPPQIEAPRGTLFNTLVKPPEGGASIWGGTLFSTLVEDLSQDPGSTEKLKFDHPSGLKGMFYERYWYLGAKNGQKWSPSQKKLQKGKEKCMEQVLDRPYEPPFRGGSLI